MPDMVFTAKGLDNGVKLYHTHLTISSGADYSEYWNQIRIIR